MDNDRLEDLARWADEAARYFETRPTTGEDKAHWANVYNAENARKAAQAIRSLLADSATKDADLAKLNELLATGANGRTLVAEATLAEARRVIAFYAAESDSGHRARTFLQENPNDAG